MAAKKILIIEDSLIQSTLLTEHLRAEHKEYEVRFARTEKGAVEIGLEFHPDIAIVDVDLGSGGNGLAAANTLREKFPDLKVVITTGLEDERNLTSLEQVLVLVKPFDCEELMELTGLA